MNRARFGRRCSPRSSRRATRIHNSRGLCGGGNRRWSRISRARAPGECRTPRTPGGAARAEERLRRRNARQTGWRNGAHLLAKLRDVLGVDPHEGADVENTARFAAPLEFRRALSGTATRVPSDASSSGPSATGRRGAAGGAAGRDGAAAGARRRGARRAATAASLRGIGTRIGWIAARKVATATKRQKEQNDAELGS